MTFFFREQKFTRHHRPESKVVEASRGLEGGIPKKFSEMEFRRGFPKGNHFRISFLDQYSELVIYLADPTKLKGSKLNKRRPWRRGGGGRGEQIPLNRPDIFLEIGTTEFSFCVEECRSGAPGLTVYPPSGSRPSTRRLFVFCWLQRRCRLHLVHRVGIFPCKNARDSGNFRGD